MNDWLRPLLKMFYAPARGMAEVRDRAALGPAVLLALLLQCVHTLYSQWPVLANSLAQHNVILVASVLMNSAGALLLIGLVYVPLVVIFANLFDRRGSYGLVVRQEYAATAATAFYALAAASLLALPLVLLARATGLEASAQASIGSLQEAAAMIQRVPPGEGPPDAAVRVLSDALPKILLLFLIQPLFLFTLWAVAAVREVFRLAWWRSLLIVVAGSILMFFASPLLYVFSLVLSTPFLLILLFLLVRGYVSETARVNQSRASFKQNLEASTLNPADASAHYNLGLIHAGRKELDEARTRFERAVEIDAEEVDAHYQLGLIARAQNRLPDAIKNFGDVVARDQTHAQHEIWREVGATYLAAGQFSDAQDALERFLDRRQSDPEGLYLMGRANAGLGHTREAVEWMKACIEAVKTSPAYKYRTDKRWLNEAQQFLRSQA